jgi:N6-adenosine-specific RNA methylase IME4
MSDAQIAMLPIGEIAAKAAHCYLWLVNAKVEQGYAIARAWGFVPSILIPWCKAPRGSAGFPTYAICTEYLLFCRRGGLRPAQRWPRNWFEFKRGKHSAKPSGMLDIIEQVTPGPRIEFFARASRPGWTAWGDECASDPATDTIMQATMQTEAFVALAPRIQPALLRARYGNPREG